MKMIGSLLLAASTTLGALSPEEFQNPPNSAKPRTWMHIMNENLSLEGFKKDLQSMSDVGIGGALVFSIGPMPKGKVPFNSPEYRSILVEGIKKPCSTRVPFRCWLPLYMPRNRVGNREGLARTGHAFQCLDFRSLERPVHSLSIASGWSLVGSEFATI